MKQVFEQMGGVPQRIWFDNLSAAVVHIEKQGQRQLTDMFRRFCAHYRFEAVFCNPYSGHEKGHVEAKCGYSKRNWAVPVPLFEVMSNSLCISPNRQSKTAGVGITQSNAGSRSCGGTTKFGISCSFRRSHLKRSGCRRRS
jgi:hypothetical protein